MCVVLVAALGAAAQDESPPFRVEIELAATEATVGDPLTLTVDATLPPGASFDPPQLGPRLGPFSVVDGSWQESERESGRWSWTGNLVSFRTGELELPPIELRAEAADGTTIRAESPTGLVDIRSVLESTPGTSEGEVLADLKPPARIEAEYGPLVAAVAILVLLLLVSAVLWWLHRRYGAKLMAVPAPDDPFRRTPPHVWVYSELQKLLERRLAEQDRFDVFFAELAWILKRYLTGRFRVDLMERTTEEVPERLRQAGAPTEAIRELTLLLVHCDRVKFAGEIPDSDACRAAIDEAYRIVDCTRPQDVGQASDERGAA